MAPAVVARYAAPLHCAINGTVVFHWAAEWHDLQRFASKQHMENCDFDGAQPLAAVGDAGTTTSFYLACATPGEEIHVGCSVADHCAQGQKLSIHVSHSVHALAADGSPLLHVDSYARVMKLLGHETDAEGFVHLTRGFQTDHLAETSLDFVWCLEPHCSPDGRSTKDWDASATRSSCLADVYNLGGFLTRKRPSPNLTLAEAYYRTALAHQPHHCPTLGYLAELHLTTANATAANATALELCAACGGGAARPARQARAAFEASGVAWPSRGACAAPPPPPSLPPLPPPPGPPPSPLPLPPPSPPPSTETVLLTLEASGSVSDYSDTSSLQQAVATAAGVDKSLVTIEVAAASVIITATIAVPASTAAAVVQTSLASTLGTAAAASTALGVAVEAVPTILIASPPPPSPPSPPSLPSPSVGDAPEANQATADGPPTQIIVGALAAAMVAAALGAVAYYVYRARGLAKGAAIAAKDGSFKKPPADLEARKCSERGSTGSCCALVEPTPTSEECGALDVAAVPRVAAAAARRQQEAEQVAASRQRVHRAPDERQAAAPPAQGKPSRERHERRASREGGERQRTSAAPGEAQRESSHRKPRHASPGHGRERSSHSLLA